MKTPSLFALLAAGLLSAVSLHSQVSREQQAALTPQMALDRLHEGHARFIAGQSTTRDLSAARASISTGQFPTAIVISCIDSRTPPELLFDQGLGEIFCGRIAGNFVADEMLGSIEYATKVAHAPLIVVLGHSGCGAIKGACDGVELGHLTTTLAAIQPAIAAVPVDGSPRNSGNHAFVHQVTTANVRLTVERIKRDSEVLAPLLAQGQVGIIGGVYDLASGRIEWLGDTAQNVAVAGE